ncbi:hypothetical protein HYG81_08805 [Natrinema zhouii]|uniref:Uncharacterized protein n=1 Tax=Natrinema zhouii TaxID=1710539 RepID=A0A7D6GY61_9EURY|nr:hypothetical protein [Natrinema zhouii]QLK27686.1 hypothetical protein HYG81_08805 [Natrinema zhouii]
MNRAIPLLLAVLLGFSLLVSPIVAAPGNDLSGPSDSSLQQVSTTDRSDSNLRELENTTNRLSLENAARSEYAEPGMNIGTMFASTDDRLRTDHIQYAIVDRQFEDATEAERRELLWEAYARIGERSDSLESREQQAVRAHAAGRISSSQLLQTLHRNHKEAAALSRTLADLRDRASRTSEIAQSMKDEQGKLEMHQTELRSQLAAAGGTGNSDTVFTVKTSENGYVISMIDENYVREAVRFDNRNASKQTQFDGISDAYPYTLDMYPWANETRSSPSFNMHTTVQLSMLDISHDHGHLEAYLDGGTGNIHREVQVLNQDSLPTESQQTVKKEGLDLTINKTVSDGPSELTVSDLKSGELLSATVTINGTEVGETYADGRLWFVSPEDGYELVVETTSGKRINTTISG